jgi:hypothetical protein
VNSHWSYSCDSEQCSLSCRKFAVADCPFTTSGIHQDTICRHPLTLTDPTKHNNSKVHAGTPCSNNTHVQYYLQLRLGPWSVFSLTVVRPESCIH